MLYQILNLKKCKFYTVETILNKKVGSRFKRDNIYFVVFKSANGISYTLELSEEQGKYYFPRSLKINDTSIKYCKEIELQLTNKTRLKTNKVRKVKWSS